MLKIDKEKLENNGRPHSRVNREYLLKKSTAAELNTYLSFSPFWAFADIVSEEDKKQMYADSSFQPSYGRPGVRSIFNKSGAVLLGDNGNPLEASSIRVSTNTPLIDTPDSRRKIRVNSGYTIKELVDASQQGILGRETYSYSDFMYCKHLGKIPNNYLITLRRFPVPVDDYISSTGIGKTRKAISSTNATSIGCMVNWMNTPGNDMEQILSYSVSMPYEEKTAQWEQASDNADSSSKPLNAAAAMFDKTYRQQYQQGMAGNAINPWVTKMYPKRISSALDALGTNEPPYANMLGWRDKNKVYGPVDAVKKVYYRGEQGIDFNQSFKLTFEYELRSYNGINGRQAMQDLISNILMVTYTTGTFWGGGYYGGGAHQNNIFANLNIMKASGGFTNFADAFSKDISSIKGSVKKEVDKNGGVLQTIKNFLNDLGGMLAGGLLNRLGRPQKAMVNSLLSPAPTGFWHVTIGNPFHPIMSMGNMILKNTTITHMGPLGIDDFPTGLRVECELERGKPRDLREIEMLYRNGNDRIYHSMGPKIFDMYTHARDYKQDGGNPSVNIAGLSDFYSTFGKDEKLLKEPGALTKKIQAANSKTPGSLKKVLMKYFGTDDTYSIYVQAAEQEFGSNNKPAQENKNTNQNQVNKQK